MERIKVAGAPGQDFRSWTARSFAGHLAQLASACVNGAIFGACLALTCLAIHCRLPIPPVSIVQPKLEKLKQSINDFDTLFIGSSRIYHQIIPDQFDRLTAARGVSTVSFNAAVDGMRPPEDAYFFDQILGFKPKKLRWVMVELGSLRVPVDPAKRGTSRIVYWHDWERLALLFREASDVKTSKHLYGTMKSLREPMADFSEHLALFLQNMGNIGRASALGERLAHPNWPRVWWPPLGPKGDGFLEIDRKTMSEKDRAIYERTLEWRHNRPAQKDLGGAASQDALDRMLRKIEDLGATPILVIPPTTAGKNFYPRPRNGAEPIVLDFSDPQKYPVLFEEENRLDTDHLNTAGAQIFTRLLADQFAEIAHASGHR